MKIFACKTIDGEWAISTHLRAGEPVTAVIRGDDDYTPKNIAQRIEKCVNAFADVGDIDIAIKEYMEWKADKALTNQR